MDVETFYDAVHDDAPLLVARPNNRAYFGGLFSKDGARESEYTAALRRRSAAIRASAAPETEQP